MFIAYSLLVSIMFDVVMILRGEGKINVVSEKIVLNGNYAVLITVS